jgi:two-component system cell cycle response regulator
MAKKILIMEDEKILQSLLNEKLTRDGYVVMAVDDGEEGMKVLQEFNPDLVLLDMMMPKMDGFEVLEKMHGENLISTFPVIVISNSGQPVEIERALALGITDYIIKVDFDPIEVMDKVKAFFASAKAESCPVVIPVKNAEEEEKSTDSGYNGDGGLAAEVAELNLKKESQDNGVKILLVEDDDFLRGICEHKLKKEGFDVFISADGLDALKQVQEKDFHLVLLDVILPNMNGFKILENIKKDPAKSSVPVIMLTNMGQESEIKKGFDLGAEDYIIKAHFSVEEIIEKIREIIKKKNIDGGQPV